MLTPNTTEILNTMKEFNLEADKFLLSVEKVEETLSLIEHEKRKPPICETEYDLVVEGVLKHKQDLQIIKAVIDNLTMKDLGYIEHHISKIRLRQKPSFIIPNEEQGMILNQIQNQFDEERPLYKPLSDFEGKN